MAQDLERLVISLEANLKAYERELARAQKVTVSQLRKIEGDAAKSMSRVEKSFATAGSAIAGFGKGLVIGGIFAAVAGLEQLVAGSISSAAAIGDLSDKLGIGSDKLQELQYGAVQANLSFEELEGGLLKFSKALGQAQNGSGDLYKILTANGFSKAQIQALSYSDALDVVADLTKNAKNEQDGLLVTTAGFGKGAADKFLEFLSKGSGGLKNFATDAHNASAIVDAELVKSAQVFDDAWSRALLHVKSGIATFVLESINELGKLSQNAGPTFGGRGGKRSGPQFQITPPPGSSRTVGKPPGNFAGSGGFLAPTATIIPDPEKERAAQQAAADLAREKKRQAEAIERVMKALELEGINLGKSNVQQEVATALARADVDAKSEQGQKITALVEANERHKAAIETTAFAAEQASERQQEYADSLTSLAELGTSAFEQWAIEGDKLSDVFEGLVKQLAAAALKASLFGEGPLAGLFGSGQSGGFFGSLFNSPKLYAKGGRIGAGQVGIAGEDGHPELIQGPANVIPFNKLGGSGQLSVVINDNVGTRVNAREQNNGFGQRELIIMIDQRMAQQTADPYSKSSPALAARGARPALKQR